MPVVKQTLFLFILILFSIFNAAGQLDLGREDHVRAAVERGEYLTAVSLLKDLASADRAVFELNNYDYLLARMAEKSGDVATAMANYQRVASRDSVLKPYALKHLSEIARESGNLMLERMYLQQIASFSPDSLIAAPARSRLARNAYESGDYNDAIRLLTAATGSPQTANSRENQLLIAQSLLKSGRPDNARAAFLKLINELPNPSQPDDIALEAVRSLDSPELAAAAQELSDQEHLQRASIYQFNRDFAGARVHYQAIIQKFPDSGITPDAVYQIGRGYALDGNYVEAINWFERVQELYPDSQSAKDALLQAASAYSRVAKYREAITRYQKYIDKYPADERLDRAYLNIVDTLRDEGSPADALKWTGRTQEAFKGKLPEAIALFAEVRIYAARGDWQSVLTDIERLGTFPDLGGTRVPGGTNPNEVTFIRAFALEQLKRYPEAIDVYLSIPDGRAEYYGWRATERLRLLAANDPAKPYIKQRTDALSNEAKDTDARRKNIQALLRLTDLPDEREKLLASLKKIYTELPNYQKVPSSKLLALGRTGELKKTPDQPRTAGDELAFLGLYDEAAPELAKKAQHRDSTSLNPKSQIPDPKSPDFAYTLAIYNMRGDMADKAVAYAEPLWRQVPADYEIELIPKDQLEMLYPAPYADSLLNYAAPRDIDSRFVLSIMRQESRYRADVKSYAAARGLMQLISSTAEKIAAELGRKNFSNDELFYPPTAILFGSQYLADLFKQFPGQAPAVAASYNAGEDNMQRWLRRSGSNQPDIYVPEVVFSQSKDYVYKVMANYRMYRFLYDENLKPR
jgi:Soluble lytic murein transglycosylase and related regulatory proteins (some contain LysM/invasin domains)